jgi:allantoin racemase
VTPVRILLINANTTDSMTEEMVDAARRVASPDCEVVGQTASHGVASIDGYQDEVLGAAAVLAIARAHAGMFDAAVVACFGDPGVDAAREVCDAPVVGIAEASFIAAITLGRRFSVLTTLDRGIPPIEDVIDRHGFRSRCASVRAIEISVLEADAHPERAADALERIGQRAISEDGADVLCLGCGGMVGIRDRLEQRLGVPIVEGVPAATVLAEGLVRCGLRTSKLRGYKQPEPNAYS